MSTLPNLNNTLPGALPGTTSSSSGSSSPASTSPPGIASAGNDSFTPSDKKPEKKGEAAARGVIAAIKAMLLQLLQMFLASANNPNPLFRISLHERALGMLSGAAAQLQNVLTDKNLEGSDVLSEGAGLNSTLNFLTGTSKGAMEEQKDTQKSYMTLNKEMATLAKPAS